MTQGAPDPGQGRSRHSRRQFLQGVAAAAGYTAAGGFRTTLPAAEAATPFEERRRAYLEYCSANAGGGRNGIFSQIARLELGHTIDEKVLRDSLAFVYSNRDCNDFSIAGLLRILYLYHDSPLLSRELVADIETCVLRFKYWWDAPGRDDRCYHTENHQIIFHGDELLAGQRYPDRVFASSGKRGREHVRHALHLIRRWIDFRVRFGFSEWLSNTYFDHDLMALANLRDFAEAPDVRVKAEMLMDVLLFEMALHSYNGFFCSTHGRASASGIKGGRHENTASITKLMFDLGQFNKPDSLGAVTLATSGYRLPPLIEKIAKDFDEPVLSRERHSINIADAPKHGLSFDRVEDGHLYWSIQDYVHPSILELSRHMSKTFGVRQFEDYEKYARQYRQQIKEHGRIVDPDLCHKALTEVHLQTYRTRDYLLSCAQDYRPGRGGFQQHIWQATLGLDAAVFTNHPGSDNERSRPNYWAGNGVLPRAAQHLNVLVCIHRVPPEDTFPFSHAYFPRDAFDEVVEDGHWVLARKGDGYLALYSQHELRWHAKDPGTQEELRVSSPSNVWVCELGSREGWKSFSRFCETIAATRITCKGLDVRYASPSRGDVAFGWEGPLRIAGKEIPLHDSKRFDNPYCQSDFTDPVIRVRRKDEEIHLDFERGERKLRASSRSR